MKDLLRDLAIELGSYVVGKVMARVLGKPTAPTSDQLRDALRVGGPTSRAAQETREERDKRWPVDAAGLSMAYADEPPPGGRAHGAPRREDLN